MAIQDGHRWGHWEYKKNSLTLDFRGSEGQYEVDLEQCNTSSGILDWILQISQKQWITLEDIGNLVRALDELAGHGLQAICDGSTKIDFKNLLH